MTTEMEQDVSPERAMQHVRAYCRQVFQQRDEAYRKRLSGPRKTAFDLLRLMRPVWHPLKRLYKAYTLTAELGDKVAADSGVSKGRQFVQQAVLYLQHGVRPDDYYQYMLYRGDMRRHADTFIYHHQMDALMNTLAENISAEDAKILQDKVRFWRHCKEHDLATIPVYATIDGENIEWLETNAEWQLPPHDLFSKPADWGQGFGIKSWRHVEGSTYRDEDGIILDGNALLERLRDQSLEIRRRVILQPLVENAVELSVLVGSNALCSGRIVTIREPGKEAEFLTAMLGLPAGNIGGSNFSDGALGAPINEETGRLGRARFKRLSKVMESYEKHPNSGERIEGFTLPRWKEAVNLAIAAHESFPRIAFVGWDVAFAKNGPVLIEGNSGFGSNSIQVTQGVPLGKSRLPTYHLWHTQATPGSRDSQLAIPSFDGRVI